MGFERFVREDPEIGQRHAKPNAWISPYCRSVFRTRPFRNVRRKNDLRFPVREPMQSQREFDPFWMTIKSNWINELFSLDLDASFVLTHLNLKYETLMVFSTNIRHERNIGKKLCPGRDIETIRSRKNPVHMENI